MRARRTSFIPESTETHFMDVSLFSIQEDVPGNASPKSRTRTRRKVFGSRMTTASAEGYIYNIKRLDMEIVAECVLYY